MDSFGKPIYSDTIEIPDIHQQQEEPLLNDNDPVDFNPTYKTSRLQRLKQHLTKRNLKRFIYTWRWTLLVIVLSILMGLVMWSYRKELYEALEALSGTLKKMGYSGYILMAALIFSSAFPPVIGYGTYQTLSGFTFGFQIGFPISYFSALLGAIVCFSLSRTFLKARVTRMLSKYPNLEAVVHAVEKKGFKLFILIRLSPYPFNLLNVVFAATNISLFHFAAGTALTLLKIALHVYIGANLTSLAKHILGEEEDLSEDEIRIEKLKSFAMIVGTIITFIGMAYIYRVAKAAIKEANLDQPEHFLPSRDDEEEELGLTLLGPSKIQEPRDSVSIDNWDDWGDEDSDDEDHTLLTKFKKDEVLAKTD
ncbi:hypothetical protein MFLAVUS_001481 [Mucor flavus]|uniref:Golgi apparatus membrane protein TVP38 n=1 Tax=Mucor flavus TaxID=439312 RepID=A0ABP9YMN6_9FUNG